MKYAYYKTTCKKCGKKILVEVFLIGVNHNASVSVSCLECLVLDDTGQFAKENKKAFNDIKQWVLEGG